VNSPEHGRQHGIHFPAKRVVGEVGHHKRPKNRYLPCHPNPHIYRRDAIASSSPLRRIEIHLSQSRIRVQDDALRHNGSIRERLGQHRQLCLEFLRGGAHSGESGTGNWTANPLLTFRRICACAYRMSPVVGACVLHRLWLVRYFAQKFVSTLVLLAATTKTSEEAPNTNCNRQIRSEAETAHKTRFNTL
jgi:hypothetical protein